MGIAKYIFYVVASITLFGIIGGLDPSNSVAEMGIKAVVVGLVFATTSILIQAKDLLIYKIS
ncbi:MAG: hypothetical protein MI700_08885 [Balneolales bacterium]|nr:hypothetical protein [Balneolales bacterium]